MKVLINKEYSGTIRIFREELRIGKLRSPFRLKANKGFTLNAGLTTCTQGILLRKALFIGLLRLVLRDLGCGRGSLGDLQIGVRVREHSGHGSKRLGVIIACVPKQETGATVFLGSAHLLQDVLRRVSGRPPAEGLKQVSTSKEHG